MNIKDKLKEAVTIRESGDLVKSGKMFLELVAGVNKSQPEYVGVMAEYVIQLRLEGKSLTTKAVQIGQSLAKDYPNNPSAIRSLAHSLTDLGGFELTEPMFNKMIDLYPNNSLKKGEEQAHLAYTLLRCGKLTKAQELISEAIKNIQLNTSHEDYIEVRESYAYFVKSLLENALGNKKQAKSSAETALAIAKKGHSPFRIAQANELLRLFVDVE